jgi:hypothetical protein
LSRKPRKSRSARPPAAPRAEVPAELLAGPSLGVAVRLWWHLLPPLLPAVFLAFCINGLSVAMVLRLPPLPGWRRCCCG